MNALKLPTLSYKHAHFEVLLFYLQVKFEFVDPVYVWLERANALYDKKIPMQWQARSMKHPESHEEVFGAGVQYGLIFREAMKKVPAGGCSICRGMAVARVLGRAAPYLFVFK